MQMGNKPNNFLIYLEDNYYDKLYKALLYYIKKNKENLIIDRFNLVGVEDIGIEDLGLKSVYIDSKADSIIEFDINVNPEISYVEITGKHRTREASGTNNLWFTIPCKAKFTDTIQSFYCYVPEEYNASKPKKPLSGNLVPIISYKEYDAYATEILEKYYPEAITGKEIVDATTLATRMGFNVIKRRISKNKTIFGQIYFDDSTIPLFNEKSDEYESVFIPANTILIDSTANLNYSYGSENITIAHECVHGNLHKKAFYFNMVFNKNLKGLISCRTSGEIKHIAQTDDTNYMESQANGIAPCLLLPKDILLEKYNSYITYLSNFCDRRIDAVENTIQELARLFKVTNYAIKKRLIDLGIDEVIGVYNFVDGKFIRPFAFKKNSLARNETYIIKTNDLVELVHKNNGDLLTKLYSGQYVYVENHLVINDTKFVEYNLTGELILSEYACLNVDECCLKFKCNSQIIRNNDVMMYCYLSRESNIDLSMDIALSSKKLDITDPDVTQRLNDFSSLMQDTLKAIKGMEFGEAIDYILKVQNLQVSEITDDPHDSSSLSFRQFERYKNGEVKTMNKRVVIAMCLAMKIPPLLSAEVLKLAGLSLSNSKEDSMLMTILMTCRNKKFDDINTMLTINGFEPLTNERKNS